jgi:hypothetical protein
MCVHIKLSTIRNGRKRESEFSLGIREGVPFDEERFEKGKYK